MEKKDLDVVTVDKWELALFDGLVERRVRDVNLAVQLGKAQPRDIRKIIREHRADLEKLGKLVVCAIGAQTSGGKANEAVDKLDVDRPMTEFIDVWYQTYQEAAGIKAKK